ncbi:hypothetical protein XENOCAPTIV_005085 [Xenoophorus captivus]|uniref:NADH dehydrogenase subunit 4L n=1 Tax=Xenoophorus captivus TaxID=1517983 RepID=A0ABV0RAT7_9TELE
MRQSYNPHLIETSMNCPLLLLSACLGCFLTLSVGLLQEVLLHTSPVSVCFLLALKDSNPVTIRISM